MSEVEKFIERCAAKGVVHMHVDWGEDAANVTAEERAKALNDVDDWLSVPANDLSSRLRGQAFLFSDSARCAEKFNCRTLEFDEMSPHEKAKAKSDQRVADLLEEAAEFIERNCK